MDKSKLYVSPSPHLHSGASTRLIMLDVLIALSPAVVASVWLFGWRSLAIEVVCVAAAMAAETLCRIVMKRPQTVGDLSAAVTGLLLALNLPVSIPLWMAALGSTVAIVAVKQMFGGIGHNFVNPALIGRIVLMYSFTDEMTVWNLPLPLQTTADAVTGATPLAVESITDSFTLEQLFLGIRGGCIGETCTLALLLGGLYLMVRRVIAPTIPVCFVGTVFLLAWLVSGSPLVALYQSMAGGLLIGAIFMATDYVTCPINFRGKILYAVLCGALTVLIREQGALTEGASFAIIIGNVLTPLIDRLTRKRPYGEKRRVLQHG